MSKDKKLKEKKKKKNRKDTSNLPESATTPGLSGNEMNNDDKQQQRIPAPPGETPPLPIYAPAEPGHAAPMYF